MDAKPRELFFNARQALRFIISSAALLYRRFAPAPYEVEARTLRRQSRYESCCVKSENVASRSPLRRRVKNPAPADYIGTGFA